MKTENSDEKFMIWIQIHSLDKKSKSAYKFKMEIQTKIPNLDKNSYKNRKLNQYIQNSDSAPNRNAPLFFCHARKPISYNSHVRSFHFKRTFIVVITISLHQTNILPTFCLLSSGTYLLMSSCFYPLPNRHYLDPKHWNNCHHCDKRIRI